MSLYLTIWKVDLLYVTLSLWGWYLGVNFLVGIRENENRRYLVNYFFFLVHETCLLGDSSDLFLVLAANRHSFNALVHSQKVLLVFRKVDMRLLNLCGDSFTQFLIVCNINTIVDLLCILLSSNNCRILHQVWLRFQMPAHSAIIWILLIGVRDPELL